jgi:hypothetical protein
LTRPAGARHDGHVVAEQWGRRWITTDTSRVALNIAKTRLMTPLSPGTRCTTKRPVCNAKSGMLRHGFDYKKVQRVTLQRFAGQRRTAGRGHAVRSAGGRQEKTARRRPLHRRNPAKLRAAGARCVKEASLDHERLEAFQAAFSST